MTEEARSEIRRFLEECRAEREQIVKELKEIDILAQQSAAEVEKLARRNAELTNRLRQIENNFDTVPRADIQNIYTAVQREQGRLFLMRGQSEKLQGNRQCLGRYQAFLDKVIETLGRFEPTAVRMAPADTGFTPAQSMVVHVIEAQEAVRKRLARQMHDGPAQRLTNVILQAEICQRLLDTDPERAHVELENLKSEVNNTFQRTRTFIADLRPMMLDDLGLVPTLRRYVRTWNEEIGIEAEFTSSGREHRLAPYTEVTLFRGVQELMENAAKHANPSRVQVTLQLDGQIARAIVEDDGIGFDVDQAMVTADERKAIGLALVKNQVQMLGGTLEINSTLGRGTRVILEIPETERPA